MTDELLELPPVTTWSFSSLKQFEKCPYSIYLQKVAREPQPPRDENHPLERGTRIHTEAEQFVRGEIAELPHSLRKLEEHFEYLRQAYSDGLAVVEEDWGFNLLWQPVGWHDEDVWCRMKLDVFIRHDDANLTIEDHKTGKSFGNEVPHTAQGQAYAIGAAHRFPDVENIEVIFNYIDEGKRSKPKYYDKAKLAQLEPRLVDRALKLTTCTSFPPKPSVYACKYCDYGNSKGTGACGWAAA